MLVSVMPGSAAVVPLPLPPPESRPHPAASSSIATATSVTRRGTVTLLPPTIGDPSSPEIQGFARPEGVRRPGGPCRAPGPTSARDGTGSWGPGPQCHRDTPRADGHTATA